MITDMENRDMRNFGLENFTKDCKLFLFSVFLVLTIQKTTGLTLREVSVFRVFAGPNAGKFGIENLRIRTILTQCYQLISNQCSLSVLSENIRKTWVTYFTMY